MQKKKKIDTKKKFDLFKASWNLMVMVDSEEEVSRLWGQLEEDFRDFPKVLEYVKTIREIYRMLDWHSDAFLNYHNQPVWFDHSSI